MARARLRGARGVLFVCHANAIRSVLAARWLGHVLGDEAGVAIRSAGLDAVPGWRAHRHAVSVAMKRGLDLRDHRTTGVTAEAVEAADLIFVMEFAHVVEMRRRFPGARPKTFLLTCLAPGAPLEIADPWDQAEAVVETCFALMIVALEPIARAVAERHAEPSAAGGAAPGSPGEPARRGRAW
jgi:protein-tyrosine-phosphatase